MRHANTANHVQKSGVSADPLRHKDSLTLWDLPITQLPRSLFFLLGIWFSTRQTSFRLPCPACSSLRCCQDSIPGLQNGEDAVPDHRGSVPTAPEQVSGGTFQPAKGASRSRDLSQIGPGDSQVGEAGDATQSNRGQPRDSTLEPKAKTLLSFCSRPSRRCYPMRCMLPKVLVTAFRTWHNSVPSPSCSGKTPFQRGPRTPGPPDHPSDGLMKENNAMLRVHVDVHDRLCMLCLLYVQGHMYNSFLYLNAMLVIRSVVNPS